MTKRTDLLSGQGIPNPAAEPPAPIPAAEPPAAAPAPVESKPAVEPAAPKVDVPPPVVDAPPPPPPVAPEEPAPTPPTDPVEVALIACSGPQIRSTKQFVAKLRDALPAVRELSDDALISLTKTPSLADAAALLHELLQAEKPKGPVRYRVLEDISLSLAGQTVKLRKGKIVSEATHSPRAIEDLLKSKAKLETL